MKDWLITALVAFLFLACAYMEKQDVDHQEKISKTPIPEQTVYIGESISVEWEL